MKVPAIKKLVETYEIKDLKQAETDITEERDLEIEVQGDDEGEQLTHILAAVWIKEQMEEHSTDFKTEIRNYSKKVRQSIS